MILGSSGGGGNGNIFKWRWGAWERTSDLGMLITHFRDMKKYLGNVGVFRDYFQGSRANNAFHEHYTITINRLCNILQF